MSPKASVLRACLSKSLAALLFLAAVLAACAAETAVAAAAPSAQSSAKPAAPQGQDDDEDDDEEDDDESEGPDDAPGTKAPAPGEGGAMPLQPSAQPPAESVPVIPARRFAEIERAEGEGEERGPGLLQKWLDVPDGMRVEGWIEAGGDWVAHNAKNRPNFGVNDGNPAQTVALNQAYLIVEKPLTDGTDWSWGFRFDNLFGVDADVFRPEGLLDNSVSWGKPSWLPVQFYGEMRAPLGEGAFDVKAGTFYALQGYEEGMAPYRPLYSTSYLYNFARPATYTGVMTTWRPNKQWEIYNGFINSPDHWLQGGWHSNYAGGFSFDSEDEKTEVSVTFTAGPSTSRQFIFDGAGVFGAPPDRLANTWLVSEVLTHELSDSLSISLELLQGVSSGTRDAAGAGSSASHWSGQGGWLSYDIGDDWAVIVRADRLHDPAGSRTGFKGDFYEATLGLRYEPTEWLMVRPEIRQDVASGARPYSDGTKGSQSSVGLDVMIRF